MPVAARLAAEGAPHLTCVVAGEQTAGQGRLGRAWHSAAGAGLYVSIVLRLPFAPAAFPALTIAIGLAVREAIEEATGVACDLRWPNDLLIGNRKCAGILVNLDSGAVIAGVGINVNHEDFPPELAAEATSLRIAAGRAFSPEVLLDALLGAVDRYCQLVATQGIDPVLRLFTSASSYASGRRVVVDQAGESIAGVTAGLDERGFLRVRKDNGVVVTILAGGVRPAGAPESC